MISQQPQLIKVQAGSLPESISSFLLRLENTQPHSGQLLALVETSCPHSGQYVMPIDVYLGAN